MLEANDSMGVDPMDTAAADFTGQFGAGGLDQEAAWDRLPEFTRSLLQVPIIVSVTIAASKKPISQIMEIGPGSVLQFDKHFESPLELDANGEPVAVGVAVRAGEFFGLQVTEMRLPPERFWSVQPPEQS